MAGLFEIETDGIERLPGKSRVGLKNCFLAAEGHRLGIPITDISPTSAMGT
jgi:hypothetical protein